MDSLYNNIGRRGRSNRRAVSTAITSVMLLSLVIAMTAGVYILTTSSINAMSPGIEAPLQKGREVSSSFAAAIEEGGLGTAPIDAGDYQYGDLSKITVYTQRSAAYVQDVPCYFRVILENPTEKVIKVPTVEVQLTDPDGGDATSELSHQKFENVLVANKWGDGNPIGFTPKKVGDYKVRAVVKNEAGAVAKDTGQVKISVSELPETIPIQVVIQSEGGDGQDGGQDAGQDRSVRDSGLLTFEVSEVDTGPLQSCEGTLVNWDSTPAPRDGGITGGYDPVDGQYVAVDNTIYSVDGTKVAFTYAMVTQACDHRRGSIGATCLGEGTGETAGCRSWVQGSGCDSTLKMRKVSWNTEGGRTYASANGFMYYQYAVRIDSFSTPVQELTNFMEGIAYVCGGKTISELGELAGNDVRTCISGSKRLSLSGDTSVAVSPYESAILDAGDICVKQGTKYAPKKDDVFRLESTVIDKALIYLKSFTGTNLKVKVNGKWLEGGNWLELGETPKVVDITTYDEKPWVFPAKLTNTIDIWIDPSLEPGEHQVEWSVVIK